MTDEQLFIILKAIFYNNTKMTDQLIMQFIEYSKLRYKQTSLQIDTSLMMHFLEYAKKEKKQ